MFCVIAGIVADQSRSRFQPKKTSPHPAGTIAAICSADTCDIAMYAMTSEHTAMMKNCATSVITTLIMPPSSTYTAVIAMIKMP